MDGTTRDRFSRFLRVAAWTLLLSAGWTGAANAQCTDLVGDLNASNEVDVTDVQCAILSTLSTLSPAPDDTLLECVGGDPSLADVNCDSSVNIVDVLLTISRAIDAPIPFPADSNGNGCPTLCDAPATVVGMPEVLWTLLDYQPESAGFNTLYGPGQIPGVTVIALLDGG